MGLFRDCTTSLINRFAALIGILSFCHWWLEFVIGMKVGRVYEFTVGNLMKSQVVRGGAAEEHYHRTCESPSAAAGTRAEQTAAGAGVGG